MPDGQLSCRLNVPSSQAEAADGKPERDMVTSLETVARRSRAEMKFGIMARDILRKQRSFGISFKPSDHAPIATLFAIRHNVVIAQRPGWRTSPVELDEGVN